MSVKFVSKKISKVRWLPDSSMFVTGSLDDEANNISMWSFPHTAVSMDLDESMDIADPQVVVATPFTGSVTDLKVVPGGLMFASSSIGSVEVYKYTNQKIQRYCFWEKVHRFKKGPAACTGISVKGNDVASVGEDGMLYIHNFNRSQQTRKIENSDVCAFTAISYLRYQEIVIGNILGYLRVWDLRSSANQPSYSLSVSGDHLGIMSLNIHPTQPHILASGHEDGTLCIWDLRQEHKPTTMLSGHSAAITEVLFHPVNPSYLYTCSMDGSVLQWDSSPLRTSSSLGISDDKNVPVGNPWLNCDASRHRLEIVSLFSQNSICVNSMDFSNNTLIWSADNEAVYYLSDINL